uniref:Uncharacterized protein n=1 Tax=Dulem virus 121 TaxID=3145598 RepID=A0AAU8B6I6_9VIRU
MTFSVLDVKNNCTIIEAKQPFRVWDIILTLQYFQVDADLLIFSDGYLIGRYFDGKVMKYEE